MEWGPVAAAMPQAAARMARVASADTPLRVRFGLSLVVVLTLAVLTVVAFLPGPRILFAILLAPVVTVAIAFGLLTALWTLVLGVAVGTFVLPPTGAPIVSDPSFPAALVVYLVEGTALALLGAIAHTALKARPATVPEVAPPPGSAVGLGASRSLDPLTPREAEVLRRAASGRGVDELARELYVSPNTVKTHLAHAYEKLGAHSRADAVACGLREGWLDSADVVAAADEARSVGIKG